MKKLVLACLFVGLLIGVASHGWGQETRPVVPAKTPSKKASPLATLPETPFAMPSMPGNGSPFPVPVAAPAANGMKLAHLLAAADHLEAAGLKSDADRIRELAEKEKAISASRPSAVQDTPPQQTPQPKAGLSPPLSNGLQPAR